MRDNNFIVTFVNNTKFVANILKAEHIYSVYLSFWRPSCKKVD